MTENLLRAALEGRLKVWAAARAPALPVAWPNVKFEPPANAPYLRAFLIRGETGSEDLEGLHAARRGIFQVTVCVPVGTSAVLVDQIVGELQALFPNNMRLPAGAALALINSPVSQSQGMSDGTHYCVPAWFRYRMDTI